MSKLPQGWTTPLITEIALPQRFSIVDGPFGSDLKLIDYVSNGSVPVLTTKNLNGEYDPTQVRFITAEKFEQLKRSKVESGDVLVAKIGSIGKCSIYPVGAPTAIIPANLCKISPNGRIIDSRFLLWQIRSDEFQEKLQGITSATAQPAFSVKRLKTLRLKLPPLNEQRRIMAKLAKLLSRVNAAEERLATIPRILKRFRQSVLAVGCSGELTTDWRKENGRISQEWEQSKLVNVLSQPLSNGRSVVDASEGFPVLRLTCLKNGRIDLTERKIGAWDADQAKRFAVEEGDFFVSRGNGSLSHLGRGGLVEEQPDPIAFPDTLIRVRVRKDIIDPRFLREAWRSRSIREQIESAAHTTAGIWKISQKDIEGFVVALPPLAEQHEIVRRVEALFKIADALEVRYITAKAYVDKLTQSILAKAFRGELVPQDTTDEPASLLLERITGEPNGLAVVKRRSRK